jgi:hypothetical protein
VQVNGQPKKKADPARATANEAALKKGSRSGVITKALGNLDWQQFFGRPVTSEADTKRHSDQVALLAFVRRIRPTPLQMLRKKV